MFAKLSFEATSSGGLRPGPDDDIATANLKSLRQAKIDLTKWVRGVQDRLRAGGVLDDAARANLASVSSYLADVSVALAEREATNEADRRGDVVVPDADVAAGQRAASVAGLRHESVVTGGPLALGRPSGRTYAQMFPAAGGMGGWASAAEFVGVVGRGLHDRRLQAATMSGNTGSEGGFAIPPDVISRWLDTALEGEIIRSRALVWPMTNRERTVPAWDLTDRSNGIAGLSIEWETEAPAADATPQVALMRVLTLRARRAAIFAQASNELAADGLDFDAQLNGIMSRAIGYGLDQSFFFGSGANQPLGVFNSAARIDVTRASANLILYDDLIGMFARMSPASIPNSVWVAHSSTIPQLATLSVAVGTGGSAIPVMTESDGSFRILTRPVIFTEKVKPLGQLGDISLFDFSQYVIGVRQEASLERSAHVGFLKNLMTYRLLLRIDGQPNISAPYQPPNSAPTQSPFVALAA